VKRGLFGSLLTLDPYQEAGKEWFITLNTSIMYWYDLVVNSSETFDSKKYISNTLKALKKEVEDNL
jgi:hypothetical protein